MNSTEIGILEINTFLAGFWEVCLFWFGGFLFGCWFIFLFGGVWEFFCSFYFILKVYLPAPQGKGFLTDKNWEGSVGSRAFPNLLPAGKSGNRGRE